jgi:hypothetical protein
VNPDVDDLDLKTCPACQVGVGRPGEACRAPEGYDGSTCGRVIPERDIVGVYDAVVKQVDVRHRWFMTKGLAVAVGFTFLQMVPLLGVVVTILGWIAQGLALRAWIRNPMRAHFSGARRWLTRWIPRLLYLKAGTLYHSAAVAGNLPVLGTAIPLLVTPLTYLVLTYCTYAYLRYSFARERDGLPVAVWEKCVIVCLLGLLAVLTLGMLAILAAAGGIVYGIQMLGTFGS